MHSRRQRHLLALGTAHEHADRGLATGQRTGPEEPFWRDSIDHLLGAGSLPRARIDAGDFDWQHLRLPFFAGFHATLPALAAAGNPAPECAGPTIAAWKARRPPSAFERGAATRGDA